MNSVFVAILASVGFLGTGFVVGSNFATEAIRQEAVEAGAAAWCVVDTAGRVEFRWKSEIHSIEEEGKNQCTTR